MQPVVNHNSIVRLGQLSSGDVNSEIGIYGCYLGYASYPPVVSDYA